MTNVNNNKNNTPESPTKTFTTPTNFTKLISPIDIVNRHTELTTNRVNSLEEELCRVNTQHLTSAESFSEKLSQLEHDLTSTLNTFEETLNERIEQKLHDQKNESQSELTKLRWEIAELEQKLKEQTTELRDENAALSNEIDNLRTCMLANLTTLALQNIPPDTTPIAQTPAMLPRIQPEAAPPPAEQNTENAPAARAPPPTEQITNEKQLRTNHLGAPPPAENSRERTKFTNNYSRNNDRADNNERSEKRVELNTWSPEKIIHNHTAQRNADQWNANGRADNNERNERRAEQNTWPSEKTIHGHTAKRNANQWNAERNEDWRQDNERTIPPAGTPNLIVGDSILRDIRPLKLDRSKNTLVKTMRGKRIRDVNAYIQNECPAVGSNLVIHIGSNDLQRHPSNVEHNIDNIISDFEELVETFHHTMPSSCQLTISAILRRNDINWQTVDTINSWLESFASKTPRISFSHSERIDNHPEGLVDGLHLTDIGTRILCKKFINIIRPQRDHYNRYNRDEEYNH